VTADTHIRKSVHLASHLRLLVLTLNTSVKNFEEAEKRSLFFWDVTQCHIPDKDLNCNAAKA
jgi:hypothetical protein